MQKGKSRILPYGTSLTNKNKSNFDKIRKGTYLIQIKNFNENTTFEGYFRISEILNKIYFSADLYKAQDLLFDNKAEGKLPVLNAEDYRYYIQSVKFKPESNKKIKFRIHKFVDGSLDYCSKTFRCDLTKNRFTSKNDNNKNSYSGEYFNYINGEREGTIKIKHISYAFRHLKLSFFNTPNVCPPKQSFFNLLENKLNTIGIEVKEFVEAVSIDTKFSRPNLIYDLELFKTKIEDLDLDHLTEWNHLLFLVDKIMDGKDEISGKMFAKLKDFPSRIASVIGANWKFSNNGESVVLCDIEEAYVRTIIHEICHIFEITTHPEANNKLMTPTHELRDLKKLSFKETTLFELSKTEQLKVKHLPDIFSRPGVTRWSQYTSNYKPK